MKKLTLQIKKEYLDLILSGEKKEEFREIRPKNAKKYIIEDESAENPDDALKPVHYDAIHFLNGYKTDRPEVIIEIKESFIEIIVDENGDDILYIENDQEYVQAQMVYSLGKVISKKNI